MNALCVHSPFNDIISVFDTGDLYSDLSFFISYLDRPLRLHRIYLGMASMTIEALFKGQTLPFCHYNPQSQTMEWKHEACCHAIYRDVLRKFLRFCYGEDQVFQPNECAAAIVVVLQLQLTKQKEEIQNLLTEYMLNAAKNDVEIGTRLLYECAVVYDECKSVEAGRLDEALSKIVLSAHNMEEHGNTIIDECLMKLPASYLDRAEFGFGQESEFHVRMKFVNYRRLSGIERMNVLERCKHETLDFAEMICLYEAGAITKAELIEFHSKRTGIETGKSETNRQIEECKKLPLNLKKKN